MNITAKTQICMVIGDPVEHSLSPAMHNAGYIALGIENDFTYKSQRVRAEELSDFAQSTRAENIRGVSCKTPHKVKIMQYLDEIDPIAKRIGAVNTIVNNNGILKGYNTDWLGILVPLKRLTNLADKKVALIGAGGAARAAAYGMSKRFTKLTIYNRTLSKAEDLAREFDGQAAPLQEISNIQSADIIINALSRNQTANEQLFNPITEFIQAGQIIFDIDYGSQTDAFLRDAKKRGAQTIDGLAMILQQGAPQFKLFTGYNAPEIAMQNAVQQALNKGEFI